MVRGLQSILEDRHMSPKWRFIFKNGEFGDKSTHKKSR